MNKLLFALELIIVSVSSFVILGCLVIVGSMVINQPFQTLWSNVVFWTTAIIGITLTHIAWPVALKYITILLFAWRAYFIAKRVNNSGKPGHIYILKRSDGVYKFGYTIDLSRRIRQHEIDYSKSFELIMRFAVPDVLAFEALALEMTKEYSFQENSRKELRVMPEYQLYKFIKLFGFICAFSVMQGNGVEVLK